jgi:hypothetical protein
MHMQDVWTPILEHGWDAPAPPEDVRKWRDSSVQMLRHAYDSYIRHGFPADDVKPKSCKASNSQVCQLP